MDLRYPIGHFTYNGEISIEQIEHWIKDIEQLPNELKKAIDGLSDNQLDTPYREGGWTIRQVIHHLSDSHMNSIIRFKLTLTEEEPTIRPYFEDRWADLNDYIETPIQTSLSLLESLHARWVILLRLLNSSDYKRAFIHPESNQKVQLDYNLGIYSWHGKHHMAHITTLRERMGW